MIATFRQLSLRHFLQHRTRTFITIFGIALGVATMVSVRLLTEALPHAYETAIAKLAGNAKLQVTNGDAGVPEELLDEVRRVPGVRRATGAVQGWLPVASISGEYLALFGVDLVADQEFRDYQMIESRHAGDPLAFLAQADSVALTTKFLELHRLKLGDQLLVQTSHGVKPLTIRSALDVRAGPATLFDGRMAVMDLFAAQMLVDLDRRFTEIDLLLDDEADVATVQAAAAKVVGGRGAVEQPLGRGKLIDELTESNRYVATLGASSAMVVGLYLIFNTMMIAVVQRRREIGILRAVGMSRTGIVAWVLAEAAVLGAAGSILGIPLGLGFARLLVPVASFAQFRAYYMAFDVPDVSFRWPPVIWGVTFGMLSSLIAAALPAREAVEAAPVENLRPPVVLTEESPWYRRLAFAGAALLMFGVGVRLVRDTIPASPTAIGVLIMTADALAATLLAPIVIRALVVNSEVPVRRLLGLTGTIASRNLRRHVGRVAITGSALYLSIGGAIFLATQLSSLRRTIFDFVDAYFENVDVWVSIQSPQGAPPQVANAIAAMDGVERAGIVRGLKIAYGGSIAMLEVRGMEPANPDLYAKHLGLLRLLDGDHDDVIRRFVRGDGAIVNEAFRTRFSRAPGDVLELPSPRGPVRIPILATYFDSLVANMGIVLIDRELYRRYWHDDNVNVVEPILRPGTDPHGFAEQVRARFSAKYPLMVFTVDEFRRDLSGALTAAFAVPSMLIVSSFAISLLGIVNSLFACILDRIREVGVLRAMGATRAQVATSVVTEAGIIGVIAVGLGVLEGLITGYFELDLLQKWILGSNVFYAFPAKAVIFACVSGVLFAALAGYFPARRAARQLPVDVLQYE